MRKSGAVLGLSRVVIPGACPRLTGMTGNLLLAILLTITLVACGDDSGTSANDGDGGSEAAMTSSSRHSGPDPESSSSKTVSSSSVKKESSSSVKAAVSSSSVKTTSSSSVAPASSSSKKVESSSSQKVASSSSTPRNDVSSSSVKVVSSSSSVISVSSGGLPSSSSKKESSSSEYVPFDHSKTHASAKTVGEDAYHQFTDPRNGRSYYYITITSDYTGKSVTVMAENLNIGEMVLGENNQNDDTKIERYCYNNDTTKCDEFGGLYQWAEMMQLPSRCNTESCADLIQENHRGICPKGWRLFTWDDYIVVNGYKDKYNDGVKGLRSMYGFLGTNQSGFSLTGAGLRIENGTFSGLEEKIAFFRPEEYEADASVRAHHGIIDIYGFSPSKQHRELKVKGFSVRCTKLE